MTRVFVAEAGERAVTRRVVELLESFGAEMVGQVDAADAVVILRTGECESAAMAAAYNVYGGPRAPMFVATWKQAAGQPGMWWREMERLCRMEYAKFERAEDLRAKLGSFLNRAAGEGRRRERRMIRLMEQLVA